MVTIEELKEYSSNLMFKMEEEEYKTLQKEFEVFIGWMNYINEIEGLECVEPLYFPFDLGNVILREDEFKPSLPVKEAISNAKVTKDNSIIVPKVVSE